MLLSVSYLFYCYIDLSNLAYILTLTCITYSGGFILQRFKSKGILFAVITIVLFPLFFFKYSNVFLLSPLIKDQFTSLFIPLGISFITFSCISYLFDVFRKEIEYEPNILILALYVAYFPKVISGPIERASAIIPQFAILKKPTRPVVECIKLLLFGLFCKIVLADKLSAISMPIFQNIPAQSGGNILFGTIIFSLQIFFDFYSYCLIALVISDLIGIKITNNFKSPYFSTSFKDFWLRWNLTLGKWFKDYLYIPLGGNRVSLVRFSLNILIVFIASGIWHGSSINFLIWGAYCGILYIIEYVLVYFNLLRINKSNGVLYVIPFIFLGWLIFSIDNIENLKIAFSSIFSFNSPYFNLQMLNLNGYVVFVVLSFLALFFERYWLAKIVVIKPNSFLSICVELFYVNFIFISIFIFWDLNSSAYLYFKF